MSHVATVLVNISSLEAMKRACQKLGLELKLNQKSYRWFNQFMNDYGASDAAYQHGIKPEDYGKCEHAITIPGDRDVYEIGLVKNPKGAGFVLVFDFWGQDGRRMMEKVGGKTCAKLVQAYTEEVVAMEAQDLVVQGFEMERVEQANGDVQLILTRD